MLAPLPSLAVRHYDFGGLFVRVLRLLAQKATRAGAVSALLFMGCLAHAETNVSVNVTVPLSLSAALISGTTAQYLGTLKPSAFFSNTYSLAITGVNPNYTPPAISSPIANATAVDRCMTYGFVWGMETERADDLNLISGLYDDALVTQTCGGLLAGTTVAADAFIQGCQVGYNVATSTITLRDGMTPVILP